MIYLKLNISGFIRPIITIFYEIVMVVWGSVFLITWQPILGQNGTARWHSKTDWNVAMPTGYPMARLHRRDHGIS